MALSITPRSLAGSLALCVSFVTLPAAKCNRQPSSSDMATPAQKDGEAVLTIEANNDLAAFKAGGSSPLSNPLVLSCPVCSFPSQFVQSESGGSPKVRLSPPHFLVVAHAVGLIRMHISQSGARVGRVKMNGPSSERLSAVLKWKPMKYGSFIWRTLHFHLSREPLSLEFPCVGANEAAISTREEVEAFVLYLWKSLLRSLRSTLAKMLKQRGAIFHPRVR